MKQIKDFLSIRELNAVRAALDEAGIEYNVDEMALSVEVGDIIRTRDIILDTIKVVREK